MISLAQTAILLTAAVVAVSLFRFLRLSSILGYVAAGLVIGPWGLNLIGDFQRMKQVSEFGIVREKIKAIPGFPAPLAVVVEHLILSHHGSLEFGSPSLPQTPEAVALHFIDDVDSKMASMRATLEAASAGPAGAVWTDRNPALRRSLLRTNHFLDEDGRKSSRTE